MTAEELFVKIDNILLDITSILEEEEEVLGLKHKNLQLRSDVQRGWIRRSGIMIPLDLVNHKLLYDSYEYHLIETFLLFFRALYKEKDNIFSEFSFRTLIELGFYRIQIFFSDKVTEKEKDKFKLLIWLADYSSMGFERTEYTQNYNKLLNEFGDLLDLTKQYYKPLLDMKEALEKKDEEKYTSLVEEIRKMISPIQGNLYSKTESLPIFAKKRIKPLYSSWSHILHGNTLLLHDLFTNRLRPSQHKLRSHWFMLICGINVIAHVAHNINDEGLTKKVENICEEADEVMKIVSQNWEVIQRQTTS